MPLWVEGHVCGGFVDGFSIENNSSSECNCQLSFIKFMIKTSYMLSILSLIEWGSKLSFLILENINLVNFGMLQLASMVFEYQVFCPLYGCFWSCLDMFLVTVQSVFYDLHCAVNQYKSAKYLSKKKQNLELEGTC